MFILSSSVFTLNLYIKTCIYINVYFLLFYSTSFGNHWPRALGRQTWSCRIEEEDGAAIRSPIRAASVCIYEPQIRERTEGGFGCVCVSSSVPEARGQRYRYLAVRFLLRERTNTWRLANKETENQKYTTHARSINQSSYSSFFFNLLSIYTFKWIFLVLY